jgi:putative spermidine/putrescine transport system permease protein
MSAVAGFLWRRPRLQLSLLLAGPLGWLVVAYLGSLAILFLTSLWQLDDFSGEIVRDPGLQNFKELIETPVYRSIVLRTVAISALVTLTCAVLAFPIAFYMAKVASPRARALLVVAVLMPLWSSYLVKVYTWRIMLSNEGLVNWVLEPFGLEGPGFGNVATWLVFSYLWLPFMILPVYAGLERIPNSLLDASGDLGASAWTTFRRVIFPLALPALVAGSIFTFSLTLGDYITPTLVSSTQFIGNVVYANVGIANNLPLAAAFATVPVLIMVVYLLLARRMGAFESV